MFRILFPTDFSPAASNALEYALNLAEKTEAHVDLLHVFHYSMTGKEWLPVGMSDALEMEEEGKALEQLELYEQKIQRRCGKKVSVSHLIDTGFVVEKIEEWADRLQPNLILMGTTGASNLAGSLLGSVASEALKNTDFPVCVIPDDANYRGLKHLSYATALHVDELPALPALHKFVRKLEGQLACVHVQTFTEESRDPDFRAREQQLTQWLEANEMAYHRVGSGNVVEGLEAYMNANRTDMLVMKVRERNLLERLFHSSQTRKMALHSDTPLMVFSDTSVLRLS